MTCADIDARLAPYVDDELAAGERRTMTAHFAVCGVCRGQLAAERLGRAVVRTRAVHAAPAAPHALRATCTALSGGRRGLARWLAVAAAIVMILASGGLVAGVVRPVPVFAAQATLDHWKCSYLGPSHASTDPGVCEREWLALQGWPIAVPSGRAAGLSLVGFRRCVLTEGRMAHLMYTRQGEAVSLFELDGQPQITPAVFDVLGYRTVIWRGDDRVYALVAKGSPAVVGALADAVQGELREIREGRTK